MCCVGVVIWPLDCVCGGVSAVGSDGNVVVVGVGAREWCWCVRVFLEVVLGV